MNEQLIVKNFGPIKDATVDFKRVTVFIGPTGGGKSTLAKLAALFRGDNFYPSQSKQDRASFFKDFSINNYFVSKSRISFTYKNGTTDSINNHLTLTHKRSPNGRAVIGYIKSRRDDLLIESNTIEHLVERLKKN
jgi:predicted ATPase